MRKVQVKNLIENSIFFKPLSVSQFSVIGFICMNSLYLHNNDSNNENKNNNITLELIPYL